MCVEFSLCVFFVSLLGPVCLTECVPMRFTLFGCLSACLSLCLFVCFPLCEFSSLFPRFSVFPMCLTVFT